MENSHRIEQQPRYRATAKGWSNCHRIEKLLKHRTTAMQWATAEV
jgi:hypothetical protein